jgi:hypothetical protein
VLDRTKIAEAAAKIGPTPSEIDEPLIDFPQDSSSPTFDRGLADVLPSW